MCIGWFKKKNKSNEIVDNDCSLDFVNETVEKLKNEIEPSSTNNSNSSSKSKKPKKKKRIIETQQEI